jgi:GNAT superfamily N-acetyltransferase
VRIERGGAGDADRLAALFDDAVRWLVARGQPEQWGTEPFSASPKRMKRVRGWAAGGGLRFAVDDEGDAGAIVLGKATPPAPPADRPELYVEVLLSAVRARGRGVGRVLVERGIAEARAAGAEQLRVDCFAGVPELAAQYERLGFTRTGSFAVGDWPGAVLTMPL